MELSEQDQCLTQVRPDSQTCCRLRGVDSVHRQQTVVSHTCMQVT